MRKFSRVVEVSVRALMNLRGLAREDKHVCSGYAWELDWAAGLHAWPKTSVPTPGLEALGPFPPPSGWAS